MPLETYLLEDLRVLARRNPDYRWPNQSKANRLEPVCRPASIHPFRSTPMTGFPPSGPVLPASA